MGVVVVVAVVVGVVVIVVVVLVVVVLFVVAVAAVVAFVVVVAVVVCCCCSCCRCCCCCQTWFVVCLRMARPGSCNTPGQKQFVCSLGGRNDGLRFAHSQCGLQSLGPLRTFALWTQWSERRTQVGPKAFEAFHHPP